MTDAPTSLTDADRDQLRERYAIERDKRLRADGNDQYLQPTGRFAHLLEDPHVPVEPRQPRTDEVTFAFVGGGFAGLVTGAALVSSGVDDVCLIEKGGDVGGTWYWNRYPGAQCDTASMVYLPLLEETGHIPTEKYAHGPEILDHCRRIARHFGLYDRAILSTEVTDLTWDDARARWVITTNRGDQIRARFVGIGTGPLHRPKLPGIDGIDDFAGHAFHTSRWDYDYTGGDPTGSPLTGLADKRVGIIGTGATAVQCIPHLGRAAGELFVFQRTPSSIDVRNNHPLDPDDIRALEPGWQREWMMNFTTLQTGGFAEVDLVKDGWTDITRRIMTRLLENPEWGFDPEGFRRAYEHTDDEKMSEIRDRVDELVGNPDAAEALKPWYRQLCKRPCFHDEYLQTFNRSNVHLVDTDGQGVERITEAGVVVAGEEYPLDCLIFASGFEVGTPHERRAGFEVTGRDGQTLSAHWADGMRSLHGMHLHGFPNLFVTGANQAANLISNYPHNLVDAGDTIAAVIAHAVANDVDVVEATAEAEEAWVTMILERGRRFGNDQECTPGYYNNEGQDPGPRALLAAGYPDGPVAFFEMIEAWRTSGDFDGLELTRRDTPS